MRFSILLYFLAILASVAQPAADHSTGSVELALYALHEGNTARAISLLQAELAEHPGSAACALLADIFIDANRVGEADALVHRGMAANPGSAILHRALGDVEFREGHIKQADAEYLKAARLDPKDARAVYGLGRIASAVSLNLTARNLYRLARNLDPNNGKIAGALAEFPGNDELQVNKLDPGALNREGRRKYQFARAQIALHKFLAGRRSWVLSSPYRSSAVSLHRLFDRPGDIYGVGVDISVNGAPSARLLLDTGAEGLLINRVTAEKANVQKIADLDVAGIGDQADPGGYLGFAQSVRVGNVEFHNCIVHVSDKKSVADSSGLLGPSIFKRFLVTLDFPRWKLLLDPLPGPAWDGDSPVDRYRGKELAGFTPTLRIGSDFLVTTRIGTGPDRFFLLDTGANDNMISVAAAHDVTKVRRVDGRVKGLSGKVSGVYSSDKVTLVFAGYKQKNLDVTTFDFSDISDGDGIEVSGILGYPLVSLFRQVILDYRDGAIKFDYAR